MFGLCAIPIRNKVPAKPGQERTAQIAQTSVHQFQGRFYKCGGGLIDDVMLDPHL